jgi:hypothetical protein
MSVGRSIVSVIVGYLIFALSAFALFQISGQPPHQAAPAPFMAGSIVWRRICTAWGICGGVTRQASSPGPPVSGRSCLSARSSNLVA